MTGIKIANGHLLIIDKLYHINHDYKEHIILHSLNQYVTKHFLLDSERSEECIDFTMIITSRNNAPISNYGGGFRCTSEYPWCIIEFSKKLRKTKKK
ncbi:Uncharacterized protein FWK35_00009172 [Aphis craccivora]|uniref:Uncharacterized protein n=1 Tax=Aphis craccivora TaxID=307492 RepID=A0A6G0ZFG4_APHCR|nr:Uncharacterized protein FWK35_00009172 [Aphis craccivora]